MIDKGQQIQTLLKKERFGIILCRFLAVSLIIAAFTLVVWNFLLIQNMSILSDFSTNIVFFFIWSRMIFLVGSFLTAGFLIAYALKGSKRYDELLSFSSTTGNQTREFYEKAIKQEKNMILIFKIISFCTLTTAVLMMGYTVLISAGLVFLDEVWGNLSWSFIILTAWSRGLFIVTNLLFGVLALYQIGAHRTILINYLKHIPD